MKNETVKFKDVNVLIEHKRKGKVIDKREFHNIVVNAGLAEIVNLMIGSNTTYFNAVAVGTGTTSPTASDTALGTEVMRVASSNSAQTTNVAGDTAQFVATFNFTSSYAITESGIFNSTTASSGTMLAKQVFGALNVVSGDDITITWKIVV